MKRCLCLTAILASLLGGAVTRAGDGGQAAAVVTLTDAGHVQDITLRVTVDDLSYRDAWMRTLGAIFDFADADSNGTVDEDEARLVPSARSVRLALGTGFTPPIAPIRSVRNEILAGQQEVCDKAALDRYYLRHGVGCLPIGHGTLAHTKAITKALIHELDQDADNHLSEAEFQHAETTLKRLDTNDDDLVGVGELVVGATYPGKAADHVLMPSDSVDLSAARDGSLVLRRLSEDEMAASLSPEAQARSRRDTTWEIVVAGPECRHSMKARDAYRCDAWYVRGRLPEQLAGFAEGLDRPADAMMMVEGDGDRPDDRSWLTSLADRNGDGKVSPEEIELWLALQQKIVAGHWLVSVHSGGGIFEVIDHNHDAALSVRELRDAWQVLEASRYTADGRVDPSGIPNQVLFVVSHGCPVGLTKIVAMNVEWFGHMDRNGDGDVSRREFTGPPDVFKRLDEDGDGLVSASEASKTP